MIGGDFAEVLAAAREGNELAFSRLWRDGNPALLRYLRVMAPEYAEDAAAETWLHVVGGWPASAEMSGRGGPGCSPRPAAG